MGFRKHFALTIFSITAIAITSAAQAEQTEFRGFSLGQSSKEIEALKSEEINIVKESLMYHIYVSGKDCGVANLDTGKVTRLLLNPCFFRLDNETSIDDFAQTIADNYKIKEFRISETISIGPKFERITVDAYKATSTHKEILIVYTPVYNGKTALEVKPQQQGAF